MAEKTPVKKAVKPKAPPVHPKYSEMVAAAVGSLKERGGSSRQAILKYIKATYKVGDSVQVNVHLKMALRTGVKNGALKQSKGTGAAGSFKLGEKPKVKDVKPKAKKITKPKVAKPQKTTTKKTTADKKPKAKTPKKESKKTAEKKKATATKKATVKPKTPTKKAKTTTKSPKPKTAKATTTKVKKSAKK